MEIFQDNGQERLFRIGSENKKQFEQNFDELYDKYKKKAIDEGFEGELKFIIEKKKILIYVKITL
jgi:hypothetical protein